MENQEITTQEEPEVQAVISWEPSRTQLKAVRTGRVITNQVVARLIRSLKQDGSIAEACRYAEISRDAYYDAVNRDLAFASLMEEAQEYTTRAARQTVRRSIKEGDTTSARWWLERRDERFQPQRQVASTPNIAVQVITGLEQTKDAPVDVKARKTS